MVEDVEALRFTDADLRLVGTLAVGQFGVVAHHFQLSP